MLLAALTVGLISACSPVAGRSPFPVALPTLQALPLEGRCPNDPDNRQCVLLLRDDWRSIVRYSKGACLAMGGSRVECQAD